MATPLLVPTEAAPSGADSSCTTTRGRILAKFLPEFRPFLDYVTSQGEYGSSHLERTPPTIPRSHPRKRVEVLAARPSAARRSAVDQWEGYGAAVDGDAVEDSRTIDASKRDDDVTATRTEENVKAAYARAAQGTIERQLEQFSVHKILTSNTFNVCANALVEIAPQRDLAFLATLADFLAHQQTFLASKIGDVQSGNDAPDAALFVDTAFTKVYRVTSAQYQRYCPERPALSQAKYDVVLRRAARTVATNLKKVETLRHKTATSILRAQQAAEQEASKAGKREKEAIAFVDAMIDAEAAKVVAWREMAKDYKDVAGLGEKQRMATALRTQAKSKTSAEEGPLGKLGVKIGAKAVKARQRCPKAKTLL